MNIANQMMEYLNREGTATPESIAVAIPELSQCGGAERALLLLRLNPRFERIDIDTSCQTPESSDEFMVKEEREVYLTSSKWTVRGSGKTDEDVVREAAEQYFATLGRPGAPIVNVVREISRTTGLGVPKVKQILLTQFETMNTNIFNRSKRQGE